MLSSNEQLGFTTVCIDEDGARIGQRVWTFLKAACRFNELKALLASTIRIASVLSPLYTALMNEFLPHMPNPCRHIAEGYQPCAECPLGQFGGSLLFGFRWGLWSIRAKGSLLPSTQFSLKLWHDCMHQEARLSPEQSVLPHYH